MSQFLRENKTVRLQGATHREIEVTGKEGGVKRIVLKISDAQSLMNGRNSYRKTEVYSCYC